jgi:hypothetical protein
VPAGLPDFAGALRELMEMSRKQRRAGMFGVSLIPLACGVFVVVLAILR